MKELSKTKQALALLKAHPEMTPYQAAKQVGISSSTLYKALCREKGRARCPACGQLVPEGFVISSGLCATPSAQDEFDAWIAAGGVPDKKGASGS